MIKVMLLDDEEHAVDFLDMLIMETGQAEVIAKCQKPALFLEELSRLQANDQLPDAVFIDIEMAEMNGLEVAEKVKAIREQIEIVFVTAYSEYAVQAFELHSLDYLLKPTNHRRLGKTLARLKPVSSNAASESNPAMQPQVFIQSLGDFSLLVGPQKERLKWRTGKVKELCAFLLHHDNRVIPTQELIERIFSENDSEKAKIHFYTSISYLRKAFKEIGFPNVVQKNENGYSLQLDDMHWDYMELSRLLADDAFLKSGHAVEQLMQLYKGEYFGGLELQAFVNVRQELRGQMLHALRFVKENSLLEGNNGRVLLCLSKMLQIAPEAEPVALELIRFYEHHGQRAEALQCAYRFRQHLKEEFGISPSKEMSEFIAELERQ